MRQQFIINIIGTFSYDCSLEKYYFKAFNALGYNTVINSNEKSDITLVFKYIPQNTIPTGTKILIFPDHTSRYKEYFNSIQKLFDYVFLCHNEPIVDNERIFYIPFAYDPETHYSINLKKDIDILFIGTRTREREFLTKIPNIQLYGSGFKERPSLEKTRELYSRAKIAINQHYKYDTNNMRDFECVGYKVFTLSDISPFKSAITYKNLEDLKEKINYYLTHPEERKKIIEKCWREAKEETYEKRAKQILKLL